MLSRDVICDWIGFVFRRAPAATPGIRCSFSPPNQPTQRLPAQVVELHNCFGVPHAESGNEVALGQDYHRSMNAQFARVNDKERIVGWCVLFCFFVLVN